MEYNGHNAQAGNKRKRLLFDSSFLLDFAKNLAYVCYAKHKIAFVTIKYDSTFFITATAAPYCGGNKFAKLKKLIGVIKTQKKQ